METEHLPEAAPRASQSGAPSLGPHLLMGATTPQKIANTYHRTPSTGRAHLLYCPPLPRPIRATGIDFGKTPLGFFAVTD